MDELDEDERLPYWVEPWPSGLALARWLIERPSLVAGKRCLDVGCGLGLTAMVAASLGGKVLAVDYASEALSHARLSARENGVLVDFAVMDWRAPALRPGAFDLALAADVMYEQRFMEPLLQLFDHVLAPDGRVLLADPERPFMKDFLGACEERGYSQRLASKGRIATPSQPETACAVRIHELRPPSAAAKEN